MDQIIHKSPQMTHLEEPFLPSGLIIEGNIVKTNTFLENETILESFEGQLIENSTLSHSIEVIDAEQESRGWFEFDKYPKWLSLVKKSNETPNVYASYSNNHLSLRTKFAMDTNTELIFDYKAIIPDDQVYDSEAEIQLYNEAEISQNCEASSEQESLK